MSAKDHIVKDRQAIVDATGPTDPLYRWLAELHDELEAELAAKGRKNVAWPALCVRAAERRIVDQHGRSPTPRRAAKVYATVRKAKAQGRSKGAAIDKAMPTEKAIHGHQLSQSKSAAPLAPPPKTIATKPAPAPAVESAPVHGDGQDEIDRVLAELKERSDRRNGLF